MCPFRQGQTACSAAALPLPVSRAHVSPAVSAALASLFPGLSCVYLAWAWQQQLPADGFAAEEAVEHTESLETAAAGTAAVAVAAVGAAAVGASMPQREGSLLSPTHRHSPPPSLRLSVVLTLTILFVCCRHSAAFQEHFARGLVLAWAHFAHSPAPIHSHEKYHSTICILNLSPSNKFALLVLSYCYK
jgi:hypothetical protein